MTSVRHVSRLGCHVIRAIARRHRDSHACLTMACAKSRFLLASLRQRTRPLTGTSLYQFSTPLNFHTVQCIGGKGRRYTARSLRSEICNSVPFLFFASQFTVERIPALKTSSTRSQLFFPLSLTECTCKQFVHVQFVDAVSHYCLVSSEQHCHSHPTCLNALETSPHSNAIAFRFLN